MTEAAEIIPCWLEFHDLKVKRACSEEDGYVVDFSFGTVYDEAMNHYGYRIGFIRFTRATVVGALQTEEDEDVDDPRLWDGSIVVDGETPAMIPIAGDPDPVSGVVTRFVYADGQVAEIRSRSVEVVISGLYPGTTPAWNPAP